MRNLKFGLLEESAARKTGRILMCYSYETDDRLPRAGILHYHVGEQRFLGPRHDLDLTQAALEYLTRSGRIPADV